MNNLKIATGSDFYNMQCIVDADSGKPVRFKAHQIPAKGWTVAKVIGSKRTGRIIKIAEGFETIDSYTMHQAQMAAETLTRDTFRALKETHVDTYPKIAYLADQSEKCGFWWDGKGFNEFYRENAKPLTEAEFLKFKDMNTVGIVSPRY